MIPKDYRFYSPEGRVYPNGGPRSWVVIDFDQRRCFRIAGPAEMLPDHESAEKLVAQYADHVGPEVHLIQLSADGSLLSVSSDNDPTWEIRYSDVPESVKDSELVCRSELIEVDRLHVCTDVVQHPQSNEVVAFKYAITQENVPSIWDELHILKALKHNKCFVDFHRVVIDDVSRKILGFTSKFIFGPTLEHYHSTFYFHWLEQLTTAVDILNLQFGIMHQDVAPRNIMVDSMDLKLFDFDKAVRIGGQEQYPTLNDVDGVVFTVYEALTKDEHFRQVDFRERDAHVVESLKEWELVIPLEDGKSIVEYRNQLGKWAAYRRQNRTITHQSEATNPIVWPEYKKPPTFRIPCPSGEIEVSCRHRKDALAVGDYVTLWERASSYQKVETNSMNATIKKSQCTESSL
ncbi:hypothetical protein LOZ36_003173 [Ophidiomyces ophidiicola]|nr:hypothetical protein LOZ36_003173 [Ophidiomyces ophidiicola]